MYSKTILVFALLASLSWSYEFLGPNLSGYTGSNPDNDTFKTMAQICKENGYATENYDIHTEDGYILELWRIPGKIGEESNVTKPVAYLMHALEADMMQWVLNSPPKAIAFILSNAGYDVWMGNNRGSKYGLKHETLNPHKKQFYRFDQEQMGTKDVPAFINFIKNMTGVSKVGYVGHSQGTTQYLMGATLMPEWYEENINVGLMLAPIGRLDHQTAPFLDFMASPINRALIEDGVELIGYYDFLSTNPFFQAIMGDFCAIVKDMCKLMIGIFIDMDPNVDNLDRMHTYLSMVPSGAGYQTIVHYAQIISAKKFQRYDFGKEENMAVYGQTTPPEFDLSKLNIPTALFAGSLDTLGDETDVEWLNEQLGDNVCFITHLNQGT